MIQYAEVGRSNRQVPDFLGEHFPLAPEAIRAAYQQYWHDTQPSYQAAREQELGLETTNTLISDFYAGHLTPQTYGGATLTPLVQATEVPELRPYALSALGTYVHGTDEPREDVLFTLGLASDQSVIRTYQNTVVDQLYPDSEQPWSQLPVNASPNDILRIRTELGVNIESHLIAAANSMRWFLSLDPGSRSDALQRARRAESLHAPISEIMGFDGVAMALQSHLAVMRLRQLGEGHYVEQARAILQHIADPHATDRRVAQMLSTTLGKSWHQQVLTHGERHGIMIGEGWATPDDLRTVWRKKTLGSTAHKVAMLPPDKEPSDIIGATVITNNARQSGKVLQGALQRIHRDPRLWLRPAPSRDSAIHVRGTQNYLAEVAVGMGYSSIDELAAIADVRKVAEGDYQVAKVTFAFQQWGEAKPLLTEIQTNDSDGRKQARVGSAAHAMFKLTHQLATPEQVEAIEQIHSRKELLGVNGLTKQSRERAEQLLYDIDTAAQEPLTNYH